MDDFEERVMHELQKFKSKRYCARFATKWIVRSSVCGVVAVLIKDRVEPDTRKEKIELYVASWALSGMLAEQAANYAGERFDSWFGTAKTLAVEPVWTQATTPDEIPQQEQPTE